MSIKSKLFTATKFVAGAAVLVGVAAAAYYFLTEEDSTVITPTDLSEDTPPEVTVTTDEVATA